jgi:chemotaxis protein MotB
MEDDSDCHCEEGAPVWMATFSDMATLLLTFFILLLSFANMDVENFKVALGSVREAFGVQVEYQGDFEALSTSPVELNDEQSSQQLAPDLQIDEVKEVRKFVKEKGLESKVVVDKTTRGIVLRIKDIVLFDVGSDELKAEAGEVLEMIAELVNSATGQLSIEGHTDNIPISRTRFPSNWELSAARATAVLRYMLSSSGVDLSRVHIAGYADVRPLASNKTEEGRGKNRRVEFLFEHPRGAPPGAKIFRLPFAQISTQ